MRFSRAVAVVALAGALAWACKDFVTGPAGAGIRSARQLRLDSAQFVLMDGDTFRLKATVLDQNDSAFDTLPAGVTLGWSTSAPGIATVDSAGLVKGLAPGEANITATVTTGAGAFAASAAGTVVQPLARLVVASGGRQADTIGATLPESLVVQALDTAGRGVRGVTVAFAAKGGKLSAATSVTDTAGRARVAWTLPDTVGMDTARATSALLPDSAAVFVARTGPGAPVTLSAVSGDGQRATVGGTLAAPLVVEIADRLGDPVPASQIRWYVASGQGSLTPDSTVTDSGGRAQARWTLGHAAGSQQASAGSEALDASVVFTATATAGPPDSVAMVAGNNQTATAGATLPIAPAVIVKDAYGNPVAGVAVTFTVLSGGGSLTGGSQTTGSDGVATVGSWTLGASAGFDSLLATIPGTGIVGNPARFGAIATAAAAASIAASAGNNQSAAVGTAVAVAPAVIVKDGSGSPMAGVAVTFAVASGGGSVTGASQTTNASGVATVGRWTLGPTAGANTLTATAAGSGIAGNPVTFSATGTSAATAVTRTWVGGDAAGPTAWSDAANWSPAGVPGATDTAQIGSTASEPVLTANVSVAKVRMTGDTLTVNGHVLRIADSLAIGGSAALVMINAADSVIVTGSAVFGGGSESGRLTAGVLVVGGSFAAPPAFSAQDFAASGTHKTVLAGTQPQTVSLYYAAGDNSHFQDLEVDGTAALTLSGRISVDGNVSVPAARAVTETDTLHVLGNVTTGAGSGLTLAGLDVTGMLSVGGSYAVGVTNFIGSGQTVPVLPYTTVEVTGGPATAAGPLGMTGNLAVTNGGALTLAGRTTVGGGVTVSVNTLTLSGNVLAVSGALTVNGTGALAMTNAADSVIVTGNTAFGGGSESGKLTAGVLVVGGSFAAPPAPSAQDFAASGTHKTLLAGTQPQTVSLYYAAGDYSHFQDLEIANGAHVTFSGRVAVDGAFTMMNHDTVGGTDTLAVNGDLTIAGDSSMLAVAGVVVKGALTVHGLYQVGVTNFAGTNQVVPTGTLVYDTLEVTGPGATTQDTMDNGSAIPTIATGALRVDGNGTLKLQNIVSATKNIFVAGSGQLVLNGHFLVGLDSLTVSGEGTVVMTNPADSLWVTGSVTFGGGDETGKLTAGRLLLEGNFINGPATSAYSFVASGSFTTEMISAQPQTISIYYPQEAHFQNLDLTQAPFGVTLLSDVAVQGQLIDTAATEIGGVTGGGHALTVGGTDVTLLMLDHVIFAITGPNITAFNDVTFQDYAPADTQLSVATAGTFTFSGLTFSTTPTTGYYVSADNTGGGLGLTIQSNLSPTAAAALTRLVSGATVNWQ